MDEKKNKMPLQEPSIRNLNFDEVALGYDEETALNEANRCLNCKNKPCVSGCPVGVKIPEFISLIKEKKYEEAYQKIKEDSNLPAICGRVCPQETQCESKCTMGIRFESVGIGYLERFVADWHNRQEFNEIKIKSNGIKVAVIGSGPSGLSCASDLRKLGYDVTIFEALHEAGGVLLYGIPEFRLPKSILKKEINNLKQMGVQIETNVVIGKTLTIDELKKEGYEAIFIGVGAGLPNFMNIPGEEYNGVFSANEILTRTNLMKSYKDDSDTPMLLGKNIVVVGGGNVAMDAARVAKRKSAENVYIVYRRSEEEMPARKEEILHAKEEGIIFMTLCNPIEIKADQNGYVNSIRCIKMELGEPDASGRRRPIEIPGSEFDIEASSVIMALGTSPNPILKSSTEGLECSKRGTIVVDENEKTSLDGVYAGGDIVTGAATVILAMQAGKKAAKSIDKYLKNKGD